MAQAQPFDPIEFKKKTRQEWQDAAAGWRKWHHVVEGRAGGQRHSATLVELARVGPGSSVLDVGGGYGEPSLAAARVVGPEGRVSPACEVDGSPAPGGRTCDCGHRVTMILSGDALAIEF